MKITKYVFSIFLVLFLSSTGPVGVKAVVPIPSQVIGLQEGCLQSGMPLAGCLQESNSTVPASSVTDPFANRILLVPGKNCDPNFLVPGDPGIDPKMLMNTLPKPDKK